MELVAAAGDGGPRSVVAFYRTAAGLPATPGSAAPGPAASGGRAAQAQALRDAFSSVVGSSQSRFEARWRAYLRRLASTRR
jgi:hypothetical protein